MSDSLRVADQDIKGAWDCAYGQPRPIFGRTLNPILFENYINSHPHFHDRASKCATSS